eukprot:6172217-Pleurochrysis_carterae.AAC.3
MGTNLSSPTRACVSTHVQSRVHACACVHTCVRAHGAPVGPGRIDAALRCDRIRARTCLCGPACVYRRVRVRVRICVIHAQHHALRVRHVLLHAYLMRSACVACVWRLLVACLPFDGQANVIRVGVGTGETLAAKICRTAPDATAAGKQTKRQPGQR